MMVAYLPFVMEKSWANTNDSLQARDSSVAGSVMLLKITVDALRFDPTIFFYTYESGHMAHMSRAGP
jgi:hypothetical protein